jgi:hypothetical protein
LTFPEIQYSGGGGWEGGSGGQICLPRPSATALLSGLRQKYNTFRLFSSFGNPTMLPIILVAFWTASQCNSVVVVLDLMYSSLLLPRHLQWPLSYDLACFHTRFSIRLRLQASAAAAGDVTRQRSDVARHVRGMIKEIGLIWFKGRLHSRFLRPFLCPFSRPRLRRFIC